MDSRSTQAPLAFQSILWPDAVGARVREDAPEPTCFHDLNLDQVVAAMASAWPNEDLAPFFHVPLHDAAAVGYRQAVFRDLERDAVRKCVNAFVQHMREAHTRLAGIEKLSFHYARERRFLGAADAYHSAVQGLARDLENLQPDSDGLRSLQAYLREYMASTAFGKLATDIDELLRALSAIRYELLILGDSVTVRPYHDEADAGADVEDTFAKFRRDVPPDHRDDASESTDDVMFNHVQAQVLDKVALLNPQTFATLDTFCSTHAHFIDPTLARFAREVCFYLAWLQNIGPLRHAGLSFCYPTVDAESKNVACIDGFDVALALKLIAKNGPVVCNTFDVRDPQRAIVVTGPNNGGKTTFARMFGQLHWLASLGCSVPGTQARLFLFDEVFTHFEREEDVTTLRGKLQDDLYRIHDILARATPRSVIILNEIFASTTLEDAVWLGRRIMARIAQLGALLACVTFLTELADGGEDVVSMVAAIDPTDPAVRTFKVECRPADGLAYAMAIADKYHVTHDWLLERITP